MIALNETKSLFHVPPPGVVSLPLYNQALRPEGNGDPRRAVRDVSSRKIKRLRELSSLPKRLDELVTK